MKYTLLREEGVLGVNGSFRRIDLSDLPPDILTVQYDRERGTGIIQYLPTATVQRQVRDLEAEEAAEKNARRHNLNLSKLQPLYKTVVVRKPNQVISDFTPFEHLLPRWEAAKKLEAQPELREASEPSIPLSKVINLLKDKGVFTEADVELLRG